MGKQDVFVPMLGPPVVPFLTVSFLVERVPLLKSTTEQIGYPFQSSLLEDLVGKQDVFVPMLGPPVVPFLTVSFLVRRVPLLK